LAEPYFCKVISRKAKYAINALVYLAKKPDREPITISQIAESEHIPQKFLEGILLDLKKAGILMSKKGQGGGYYLHKEPSAINILEVMRLFDGPIALLPCVSHLLYEKCEECKDEASCGIRSVFTEVRMQTVEMLRGATLEEIINRETKLSRKRAKQN